MGVFPSAIVLAILLLASPVSALLETLDDQDISRALAVANGSDAERARFHARYTVAVDNPLVESMEVITEFRRIVLAAEDELRAGNWMMARGGYDARGRSLKDRLKPQAGHVTIRARLRFHPQNVYVTLPAFDILLGEPTLLGLSASSTPQIVPATGPGTRDVITGALLEAAFNAPTIGDREVPVRVISAGQELVRARIDFSLVE